MAFSQRRKILRHTLGKWLEQKGFAGDFDVQRRAEEVPVAEYVALAQAVAAVRTPVTRDGLRGCTKLAASRALRFRAARMQPYAAASQ